MLGGGYVGYSGIFSESSELLFLAIVGLPPEADQQIIVTELDVGSLQAIEEYTVLVATLIHCSMQFI